MWRGKREFFHIMAHMIEIVAVSVFSSSHADQKYVHLSVSVYSRGPLVFFICSENISNSVVDVAAAGHPLVRPFLVRYKAVIEIVHLKL